MIYNELNKIPLDKFIEVYSGNMDALIIKGKHTPEELKEASENLLMRYAEIVGGKSVQVELARRTEHIALFGKLEVMKCCEALIEAGDFESVSRILREFGFNIPPDKHTEIKSRLSAIKASAEFRREMLMAGEKEQKPDKTNAEYFIKEKALLMSHFKMTFQSHEITAHEYAYLVKRMCDELTAQAKAMGRVKGKK